MNVWIKIECTHGCLSALSYEAFFLFQVLCRVWDDEDVFITSTDGDRHLPYSRHYRADAFDVRPPVNNKKGKLDKLRATLGSEFDIIDEGNHIHCEYDPKGRKG